MSMYKTIADPLTVGQKILAFNHAKAIFNSAQSLGVDLHKRIECRLCSYDAEMAKLVNSHIEYLESHQ